MSGEAVGPDVERSTTDAATEADLVPAGAPADQELPDVTTVG